MISSPKIIIKWKPKDCSLDVGVLVEEFHAFLKTPHAALQKLKKSYKKKLSQSNQRYLYDTKNHLCYLILGLFRLLLHV